MEIEKQNRRFGFTSIELLVVVIILIIILVSCSQQLASPDASKNKPAGGPNTAAATAQTIKDAAQTAKAVKELTNADGGAGDSAPQPDSLVPAPVVDPSTPDAAPDTDTEDLGDFLEKLFEDMFDGV